MQDHTVAMSGEISVFFSSGKKLGSQTVTESQLKLHFDTLGLPVESADIS